MYSVLDAIIASAVEALEDVELTLDPLARTLTDGDGGLVPGATLEKTGARLAAMRHWVTAAQAVFGRPWLGADRRAGWWARDSRGPWALDQWPAEGDGGSCGGPP